MSDNNGDRRNLFSRKRDKYLLLYIAIVNGLVVVIHDLIGLIG